MGVISLNHKHQDIETHAGAGSLKPTWQIKVTAFVIGAVIMSFFVGDPHGYGWGSAIIASVVAIVIPMMAFRKFWNMTRFWIILIILSALQIRFVIAVHPLIDEYRFIFMLLLASVDLLMVTLVIYWTCA